MRRFLSLAAMMAVLVFLGVESLKARTWIFAHAPMSKGTIATAENFDTAIHFAYSGTTNFGDVVGVGGSIDIDIWMFDTDGTLLTGGPDDDVVICEPCSLTLNSNQPKASVRLDNYLNQNEDGTGGPGFPRRFVSPYVIINADSVDGADLDQLMVMPFVSNSQTGPFALSVFGFEALEISSAVEN